MPAPLLNLPPFAWEAVTPWPRPHRAVHWKEVTAVAIDAEDRVHVMAREPNQVFVFDEGGTLLHIWGEGCFARPHGLTALPQGGFLATDDLDHTVKRFSRDYELQGVWGTSGRPSDTGATSIDYRTIVRAGPPFYFPTNTAVADDQSVFVADGYGNARIHHFSPTGELWHSWGAPGNGPGEFHIPHGIAIDAQGVVHVADRENDRIQQFDQQGRFLGQWQQIARPCQIAFDDDGNAWIAELGYRAGMWPGTVPPTPQATGGRVTVFDRTGNRIGMFGGGESPTSPGDFFAPHDIAINARGDVWVAEVTMSAGGNRGLVDPSCHALQKFVRVTH